jgi:hypothetical protein
VYKTPGMLLFFSIMDLCAKYSNNYTKNKYTTIIALS